MPAARFPRDPACAAAQVKSLLLRQKEQFIREGGLLFLIPEGDLNGSGMRKRAGGTFSPPPGLRRSSCSVFTSLIPLQESLLLI